MNESPQRDIRDNVFLKHYTGGLWLKLKYLLSESVRTKRDARLCQTRRANDTFTTCK